MDGCACREREISIKMRGDRVNVKEKKDNRSHTHTQISLIYAHPSGFVYGKTVY